MNVLVLLVDQQIHLDQQTHLDEAAALIFVNNDMQALLHLNQNAWHLVLQLIGELPELQKAAQGSAGR